MQTGKHAADGLPDGSTLEGCLSGPLHSDAAVDEAPTALPGKRRHRRVTTDAVPGSDPEPTPEPRRHAANENDDRLKADKPPHWQ